MIDLAMAKLQQRIDGSDEDELLQLLLDAAVADCTAYLNRPLYTDTAAKQAAEQKGAPADGIVINAPIKAAMLLMFGYLNANREGQNTVLPASVRRILDNYRRLPGV